MLSDDTTAICTCVTWPNQVVGARLLTDSLRAFGGPLADAPVWVYQADPEGAPCDHLAEPGVEVLPVQPPSPIAEDWFGPKVTTLADAEARADGAFDTLIWIATDCLIVQPPALLALGTHADVAVRPVHHRNVGLLTTDPIDPFWHGVYDELAIDDVALVTRSFVGDLPLRAYFNTHALAVRPELGLCRSWLDAFVSLAADDAFQAAACSDVQHRIFLHQAPFSALVASRVPEARIRILPPTYSYPYNLHDDVPTDRRAASLNDLVTVAYEDLSLKPADLRGITVCEPLRSWLAAHVAS